MLTRRFTFRTVSLRTTLLLFIGLLISPLSDVHAQVPGLEAQHWYFGIGTDGLTFPGPVHTSSKQQGMGFEGMIVANDPSTGNLLFYSDGAEVRDANNNLILGGSGLNGHTSGTQCVQAMRFDCTTEKYYLFTNTAWDLANGDLYYSILDFTNNPNGQVTNVNTPITSTGFYNQGNVLVRRPETQDYWWIAHVNNTATYHVFAISGVSISGPTTFTFSRTGDATTMAYSGLGQQLAVAGYNLGLVLLDFDPQTGILSNEIIADTLDCALGDFSPDGKKVYYSRGMGLFQYDSGNGVSTNLNTCCYAHDTQRAPNGKMYHIHTYSSTTPLAEILYPNLSGTACGYTPLPMQFNGAVRRFPEFLSPCDSNLTRVEADAQTATRLFPNPVSTVFELEYAAEAGNVTSVEVVDLLGRSVPVYMEFSGTNTLRLDVSHLLAGCYTLRILFEDTQTYVQKRFVKE
jgi:hypothetical protein